MPFYYAIDSESEAGRRTAGRLLRLRQALAVQVPARTLNDTLLLATWNIREFDSKAYGDRLDEAFYYIAEIISHFDLVAIQEIREDLGALMKLNRILGSRWDFVVTEKRGAIRKARARQSPHGRHLFSPGREPWETENRPVPNGFAACRPTQRSQTAHRLQLPDHAPPRTDSILSQPLRARTPGVGVSTAGRTARSRGGHDDGSSDTASCSASPAA